MVVLPGCLFGWGLIYAVSPIELAVRSKRTLLAFRFGPLAQFLAMMTKDQVGLNQPGVILIQFLFNSFLNEPVSRGGNSSRTSIGLGSLVGIDCRRALRLESAS
jgi:hypothetical protein